MFPETVRLLFHPLTGMLSKVDTSVDSDWLVNNLPDMVGEGRATTYAKYVHEFVMQEYLREDVKAGDRVLTRTGKSSAKLLERALGMQIAAADRQPLIPRDPEPPQ